MPRVRTHSQEHQAVLESQATQVGVRAWAGADRDGGVWGVGEPTGGGDGLAGGRAFVVLDGGVGVVARGLDTCGELGV